VGLAWYVIRQCRKPTVGSAGSSFGHEPQHAGLTSWGLQHIQIGQRIRFWTSVVAEDGLSTHLPAWRTSGSARRGLRGSVRRVVTRLNRVASIPATLKSEGHVSHLRSQMISSIWSRRLKHTTIADRRGGHARDLPCPQAGASVLIIAEAYRGAGSTSVPTCDETIRAAYLTS